MRVGGTDRDRGGWVGGGAGGRVVVVDDGRGCIAGEAWGGGAATELGCSGAGLVRG
jgi:hypothetical protein